MFLIFLTFVSALALEVLGTTVSVIGLSALFGSNPIIIALAIALDLAKIVVVTLVYTYWSKLSVLMRGYALVAAFVTMLITSAGSAGYLSAQFQQAVVGVQEGQLKVQVLKDEQGRLQKRKEQIDDQISKLPERYTANQRVRLIGQFKQEQASITKRLGELDRELPTLQVGQIGSEAKAGPILYVAKAFDTTVEDAVKWVILMIIFVFDPLAVFLIVAGNFLLRQHRGETTVAPEAVHLPTRLEEQTPVEVAPVETPEVVEIIPEVVEPEVEVPKREEITRSTLGLVQEEAVRSSMSDVRPDPYTKMFDSPANASDAVRSGIYGTSSKK